MNLTKKNGRYEKKFRSKGKIRSRFKILAKFHQNFAIFGNFGCGRKKNRKFHYILIHVLYNFILIFSIVYIAYILLFNRSV